MKKSYLSVTNVRPIVVGRELVPTGTSFRLHSMQKEWNELIRIHHQSRWYVVDPVDFKFPPSATAHLKERERIYAVGLEPTLYENN